MSALALVEPREATASLSLYEMSEDLVCLLDTRDMVEAGTADAAELDAQIQRFQDALPRKVDSVCRMLAHLESQAAAAKLEAARLSQRQKQFESRAASLEGYCVRVLEALPAPKKGPRKLEGEFNALALSTSERCKVEDPLLVPIEYKTAAAKMPAELWQQIVETLWPETLAQITVDVSVRLADVKKALKAGVEIEGADIEYPKGVRRS